MWIVYTLQKIGVEAEVDRRIKYYATQIGGEARLEEYLGKSVSEYKDQMRPKNRAADGYTAGKAELNK